MTTWLTRGAAAVLFIWFLATSFRTGWTQNATDFPNYYTAAVSVREGQPLRNYYNWTWFNQQIKHVGIEHQLGAYAPQTPLAMLPMIPLAGLSPMDAKRVWLSINLVLLIVVVYMLSRDSGKPFEQIALLTLLGHNSLASNFIYGQYYVFLLFLITLTYRTGSGFLAGVTFALKLYTGPLLLYFIAKRNWRSAAGMLMAIGCTGALAIAMFGWSDIGYYLTHILPRTLEGASTDPYNPGVPAISTMLRHTLMREPQLNPNPILDVPWLFFFARTVAQVGLITFATFGIAFIRSTDRYTDLAWFVILSLLLSTSTASYSFVLLLAPVALLLRDASHWKTAYLVASYILLSSNLQPLWLFPKVWLLLALFFVVGWRRLRDVPRRASISAATIVLAFASVDASRHLEAYSKEPGRRYQQLPSEPVSYFRGYLSVNAALSPDGKWEAFTRETLMSENLWIRNVATGATRELAGGDCNSARPTWEADSSAVVFASDCGRAFGLTALYRARVQ